MNNVTDIDPIFIDHEDIYYDALNKLSAQDAENLKICAKIVKNSLYGTFVPNTFKLNYPYIPNQMQAKQMQVKQITYGDFDITDLPKHHRTLVRRIFSKVGEIEPQNLTLHFDSVTSVNFVQKILDNLYYLDEENKINLIQIIDKPAQLYTPIGGHFVIEDNSFEFIRSRDNYLNKNSAIFDKVTQYIKQFDDRNNKQKFLTVVTYENDYIIRSFVQLLNQTKVSTLTILLK